GSMILFAPPLTILGMVAPYVLKLALADLQRTGRTAGTLYAVSTVGSVAGTILTGFILIPELGIAKTFWVITLVMLAPPVAWFGLRRRWMTLGVGGFVVLAGMAAQAAQRPHLAAPGTAIIAHREGLYAEIKVVDQA